MKRSSPQELHTRSAPARLLETAADAFARKGYEGASLREIADNAGFAFQLITYHFGSKEELWKAVMRYLIDQRMAAIRAAAADPREELPKNPRLWLRSWIRTGILFSVEDPKLRQIVCQEYFANSDRLKHVVIPMMETMWGAIGEVFSRMTAMGVISRFSTAEALLLYRSIIMAIVVMPYELELTTGLRMQQPKFVETLLDLLISLLIDGKSIGLEPRASVPAAAQRLPRRGRTSKARKARNP